MVVEKKILFSLFFAVFISTSVFGQDVQFIEAALVKDTLASGGRLYEVSQLDQYVYFKPRPLGFVKNSFQDIYYSALEVTKKKNRWGVVAVAASTALLITFDEQITRGAKQFGRYINLEGDNDAKNISPINGVSFFVPTDVSSSLYYIGDGITELGVNLGFYIYGFAKKDSRALRTATQLTEGMIAVGVSVQLLKHLSGRCTAMKNDNQDLWRPFPTLDEYHGSVPSYDAFPSGHLATAMMTTTVIAMNYPEYKFIKPLCYTLMGLCGYQMLNNGVHWAGDYPLALAMGYTIGRIAVNRGRLKVVHPSEFKQTEIKPKLDLKPTVFYNGTAGLTLSMKF